MYVKYKFTFIHIAHKIRRVTMINNFCPFYAIPRYSKPTGLPKLEGHNIILILMGLCQDLYVRVCPLYKGVSAINFRGDRYERFHCISDCVSIHNGI